MQGTIQNRESFLLNVAKRLGRDKVNSVCKTPEYKYNPQNSVLQGLTQDQLVEVLKEQCKNIHTTVIMASRQDLPAKLSDTVKSFGGGTISVPDDKRFAEMGLDTLMKQEWPKQGNEIQVWDPVKGQENIDYVEKANIGIVISDITLAESGTVTILIDKGKGRNINFLPENSIMIVPKSTIVPRMTQAAKILREKVKNGEKVPSCINFISGPSNSADIELNLVVGVHGPVRATYIVVDDQ